MHVAAESKERRPTTARLLAAAADVFAKRGLSATTREIAEAAHVNEATLFRQFETKEHLIAAVTAEIVKAQSEALDAVDLDEFDLRKDMTRLAEAYEGAMAKHSAFIRTMMSQPADPDLTERILREVVQPVRAKFVAYLTEGRHRGKIRDIHAGAAMDAFTGMLFAYVLRCGVYRPGYSRGTYLQNCVEIFLEGIERRGHH